MDDGPRQPIERAPRRTELNRKLRRAFLEGAEERSRETVGRGLTEEELGRVLRRMRKCIGSAKFGIEAHEAPVGNFPAQPSQKDGLGRMCKPH